MLRSTEKAIAHKEYNVLAGTRPPLPAASDAFGPTPPDDHLTLIRQFGLADLPADSLYVRRVALANDAVDRSYERIPVEKLHRLAETLPGKSMLAVHNKQQLPLGLWYSARVRPSAPNEPGDHTLEAYFYLVKSPENQHLRDMIDGGVIRHTSIAFRYADRTCSTCGQDAATCPHMPGDSYDGPPTYFYFTGDPAQYESTEASLVHLGAQKGSLITKAAGPHFKHDAGDVIHRYVDRLLARASDHPTTQKEAIMEIEKALARIKELEKDLDTTRNVALLQGKTQGEAQAALESELATAKAEGLTLKTELEALKAPDDAKQQLALDGTAYREHLKTEITRLAGILKREAQAKTLVTLAGNCGSVTLKAIFDELAAEVEAKFPPRPVGNPMSTDKSGEEPSPTSYPGNFSVL